MFKLLKSFVFILFINLALPCFASPVILILGDSLSAGHGISANTQWSEILSHKIKDSVLDYTVVNASVSGATTTDGLRQLPDLLNTNNPQIVILALGSNDGLRGNQISAIESNLGKMIDLSKQADAKVLLVGFHLPPNYGSSYREKFAAIFPDLSKKYGVPLVPFLLDGFADDLNYFQADQLHPTTEAQPIIAETVWKHLQPMLKY